MRQNGASDLETVYGFACNEVLIDNFVDIGMVHVLVPGLFRIDDQHRSILAAVQAACGVDTDLVRAADTQLLAALLGVIAQLLGATVITGLAPIITLVGAEEYVVPVVAHGQKL
jgi:hypothetical protein